MSVSELSSPPLRQSPSRTFLAGVFSHRLVSFGLLAISVAFLPRLLGLGWELWTRPQYQFFPVVLIGALILVRERSRQINSYVPGKRSLVYPILALSWSLLAVAALSHSSWLAGVAALVFLVAAILAVGGWSLLWKLLPVWLFLWLAMPLPLGQDNLLVLALQPVTTEASSRLLDLAHVPHVREGNLVTISGKQLFVDESCSGIHSLYSALACTAFMLLWLRRGVVHGVLLLAGTVVCVVAANVARVTMVAYLEARWHVPASDGWRHELAGWLAFGFALCLIASMEALLLFLLGCPNPAGEQVVGLPPVGLPPPIPEPTVPAPLNVQNTILATWPVMAAFSTLAIFQLAAWGLERAPRVLPGPSDFGEHLLPESAGAWHRIGFEIVNRHKRHELGENSQVWRYQGHGDELLVSLDYPFSAWHDVSYCYKTQGWVPVRPNQDGQGGIYTTAELAAAGGRRGFLWFGAFDAAGRDQPIKTLSVRVNDRLDDLFQMPWSTHRKRVQLPVYQVQLLVECYHHLSEDEEKLAEGLYFEACKRLKDAMAKNSERTP